MKAFPLPLFLLLAGCATAPTGPVVLVLPGTGKSFDEFHADERDCRQAAQNDLQSEGAAPSSRYGGLQRRYDNIYQQCMYAKGHRIPSSGRFTGEPSPPGYPPPYPAGRPPQ